MLLQTEAQLLLHHCLDIYGGGVTVVLKGCCVLEAHGLNKPAAKPAGAHYSLNTPVSSDSQQFLVYFIS